MRNWLSVDEKSIQDERLAYQMMLVAQIRAQREAGELVQSKRSIEELLASIRPVISEVVRKVLPVAGSLTGADLRQVAAISAIKAIDTYRSGMGQSFGQWAYFPMLRDCRDQTRLHGADVHLSHGAITGRTVRQLKGKVEQVVQVTSRDAQISRSGDDDHAHAAAEAMPHEQHDETPEQLLGDAQERAQLFELVRTLPSQERELVSRVYGINRPAQSVRSIADEWRAPKSRIDRMLARALETLREMMTEE